MKFIVEARSVLPLFLPPADERKILAWCNVISADLYLSPYITNLTLLHVLRVGDANASIIFLLLFFFYCYYSSSSSSSSSSEYSRIPPPYLNSTTTTTTIHNGLLHRVQGQRRWQSPQSDYHERRSRRRPSPPQGHRLRSLRHRSPLPQNRHGAWA